VVRFIRELCDPEIRAYWQALYGLDAPDDALASAADTMDTAVHALLDRVVILRR
jgi:hypothetical protein